MEMFTVGVVPTGWTRGEKLDVLFGHRVAMVLPEKRVERQGDQWSMTYDIDTETPRVREWLKWWYSTE